MSASNPQSKPSRGGWLYPLFLLALAVGIYVGTAAKPALVDESDCGHAIASREIRETGDWAVLHINGIRYLEKAPLHYWLVAASYKLLGESAFATRLPVALGVAGLVLMVYWFGRRFFSERAGFYAGLAMCTSLGTFIFTRTMIPEAIYALEFTAAFCLFLLAWTGAVPLRAGFWASAALAGLAVLTHGLIGAIFPGAILGLFLLCTGGGPACLRGARSFLRDHRSVLRRRQAAAGRRELPWVSSTLIFLVVAAPWHLIAGLRAPGFFWFYFINEHFLRAIGARYPQDYATVPLLYWWAAHLAWFFPWSFFLPLALKQFPRPSAWHDREDAASQARLLLFLWAGFILSFFSLTRRMEYYSFGAWPAIALLLGSGMAQAEQESSRWLPRLRAALAVAGALIAASLGTLLWVSRHVASGSDIAKLLAAKPAEFYKTAMANFFDLTPQAFGALRAPAAAAGLAALIGLGAAWVLRRSNLAANIVTALAMTGFLFSANLAYRAFEPWLSSRALAEAISQQLRPDDRIVLYGDFYSGCTVSFYTHRKTWLYNGRYYGLEFGSYYPDAPRIFLTDSDFPGFWRGPRRVFLFVPKHKRKELLVRLPLDSTYLLAESGGKAVYVNRPLSPNQPTLAQLGIGSEPRHPAPNTPRSP